MECNVNETMVVNDIDQESLEGSITSICSDEDILDTSGNVPYQFEPVPVVGENMQQNVHGGGVAVRRQCQHVLETLNGKCFLCSFL